MARTDELIKQDVVDQLTWDDSTDASKIAVEVDNGTVTLKGKVPSYLSKSAAESDALGVLGVTNVNNQLEVRYPSTQTFPSDTEIEENVRDTLAINPDIDLQDLEVSVSTGFVTLKGTVDALWKKVYAENLVETEGGVLGIENHLAVVPSRDILDKDIAADIVDSIERKAIVNANDVTVEVSNGHVRLTGTVPTHAARRAAYESAMYTYGVVSIEDHLNVSIPEGVY